MVSRPSASASAVVRVDRKCLPGQRVEGRDRLVEQQQPWPLGQREREADLRPLAAGQRADRPVERDVELAQPGPRGRAVPSLVQVRRRPGCGLRRTAAGSSGTSCAR